MHADKSQTCDSHVCVKSDRKTETARQEADKLQEGVPHDRPVMCPMSSREADWETQYANGMTHVAGALASLGANGQSSGTGWGCNRSCFVTDLLLLAVWVDWPDTESPCILFFVSL